MKRKTIISFISAAILTCAIFVGSKFTSSMSKPIEASAATTIRLYCNISAFTQWTSDSANFGVHTWNSAKGDKIHKGTKISTYFYYVDLDLATYASGGGFRWARCNSAATERWNDGPWQSYNASSIKDYFKVSGWTSGTWTAVKDHKLSIVGSTTGNWTASTQDINISLTNSSTNAEKQFQIYGTNISLTEKSVFKVYNSTIGAYYGYGCLETNDLTKPYLTGDANADTNITVSKTGVFEVYYKPGFEKFWIQVDSTTEATSFSETFLSKTGTICSANPNGGNANALSAIWNSTGSSKDKLQDLWVALTDGAKSVFTTGTANTTISNANARYVFLMNQYGATLKAFINGPEVAASYYIQTLYESKDNSMLIIILSVSALSGLSIFILTKKKKIMKNN